MNSRKWTDDDLRQAVSKQRSWRGVARALGLRSTSGGWFLSKHAACLGLDTSHFSGPRRWSDQELEDAVSSCSTWSGVSERLGLRNDRRTSIRLRGHAMRIGLDVTHLNDQTEPLPSAHHELGGPLLSELRAAAPSLAAAWFSLRAIPVAIPIEPQAYDLLVSTPKGTMRVQVKTTTFMPRKGTWQVSIGHRPYSLDKSASKDPYEPEVLDYFFVIDGSGGLYLIPMQAVAGRTSIYLSGYEEYRVGSISSLLEAA